MTDQPTYSLDVALKLFEEAMERADSWERERAIDRLRDLFCLKCGSRNPRRMCGNDE